MDAIADPVLKSTSYRCAHCTKATKISPGNVDRQQ